jgi:ribosomal protein L11 methyltransferase
MEWIEVVVHTTTEGSDLISDLLMRCGAMGTQVTDRADVAAANKEKDAWELFDQDMEKRMPEDVHVTGWFTQEEREKLNTLDAQLADLKSNAVGLELGSLNAEITLAADNDWAEGWKRYYKPFRIGSHLIVKPTWEPYRSETGDIIIELDPGMAFGTGTHETTNMSMIMLEKYLEKDMRVMDIGTGSGILAIAAAKLGAQTVLAVDIDPDAVKVAKDNIERNGVNGNTTVIQGDMVRTNAIPCDLAVANIVAGAVNVLAEPLKRFLRPGGYFLCSGIIKEREQDVLGPLKEAGYEIVERLAQGEWVGLCARRER